MIFSENFCPWKWVFENRTEYIVPEYCRENLMDLTIVFNTKVYSLQPQQNLIEQYDHAADYSNIYRCTRFNRI
jgi:hypothetical protein